MYHLLPWLLAPSFIQYLIVVIPLFYMRQVFAFGRVFSLFVIFSSGSTLTIMMKQNASTMKIASVVNIFETQKKVEGENGWLWASSHDAGAYD